MQVSIRRGKTIGLDGRPRQEIAAAAPTVDSVAVLGLDYPGLRFSFDVEPGQRIAAGQVVLTDRHRPRFRVTSPVAGVVRDITRGPRRSLGTLTIDIDGEEAVAFDPSRGEGDGEALRNLLLDAGQWASFIRRPFGRVPDPDERPGAIFVTAMDTNPLAADAAVVLRPSMAEFRCGLDALTRLTDGTVYVCHAGALAIDQAPERVTPVAFRGPHPAGLPGTHIHRLAPQAAVDPVWQVNYQDVVAIGALLSTGRVAGRRTIALAGRGVAEPGLVTAPLGADTDDLLADRLTDGRFRIVAGSPLTGRMSRYLGRYHQQVSVLAEPSPAVMERLLGRQGETAQHGHPGPFVPVAAFDRVMPQDIMVVPLLRALLVGDEEAAQRLGCLDLIEEDMALLSYVCPAKIDYAPLLRNVLDKLEEAA